MPIIAVWGFVFWILLFGRQGTHQGNSTDAAESGLLQVRTRESLKVIVVAFSLINCNPKRAEGAKLNSRGALNTPSLPAQDPIPLLK